MNLELSKIYNLYEIFNDFNRVRVLVTMYNNSYTCNEITTNSNLKSIIVKHELDFLLKKKIISKIDNKYIISDKKFNKIINQIINYSK